jgi:hypothetical protein
MEVWTVWGEGTGGVKAAEVWKSKLQTFVSSGKEMEEFLVLGFAEYFLEYF